MPGFSSPAIMLRRIAYGDNDLIITLFTLCRGKVAAIAKSAKKSRKRFPGILEPFSVLEVVCRMGRREKGLPVLTEAALVHPFPGIRADIRKTGYASYWAEIINEWMEEHVEQAEVYHLFHYALKELDQDHMPGADLSILFQIRFLTIVGLGPNLTCCCACKTGIENVPQSFFSIDLGRGGLICNRCGKVSPDRPGLSKGTLKQLLWIQKMDLLKAARVKFTSRTREEGLAFLEAFVPYHLGKIPKSLKVLRQVRKS